MFSFAPPPGTKTFSFAPPGAPPPAAAAAPPTVADDPASLRFGHLSQAAFAPHAAIYFPAIGCVPDLPELPSDRATAWKNTAALTAAVRRQFAEAGLECPAEDWLWNSHVEILRARLIGFAGLVTGIHHVYSKAVHPHDTGRLPFRVESVWLHLEEVGDERQEVKVVIALVKAKAKAAEDDDGSDGSGVGEVDYDSLEELLLPPRKGTRWAQFYGGVDARFEVQLQLQRQPSTWGPTDSLTDRRTAHPTD